MSPRFEAIEAHEDRPAELAGRLFFADSDTAPKI
jgi:hypothetical protein